jgi:hypothetical protein
MFCDSTEVGCRGKEIRSRMMMICLLGQSLEACGIGVDICKGAFLIPSQIVLCEEGVKRFAIEAPCACIDFINNALRFAVLWLLYEVSSFLVAEMLLSSTGC